MGEEEEKKKMLGLVNPVLANLTPEQLEEAERIHKELATVTPTPTPVVKEEDVEITPTGVDYLKQFTEKYTPEVLTEEELNRRKRAAHVMSGIGALGNAASAISNLIYTGEGAPSQTLPKNVGASAEIAKLEETEKAKRNEIYQRAKDRVAQEQAKEALKYKYAKDAQDNQYKAAQLKMQLTDLDLKIRKAEREGKLDEARTLTEQWKALKAQQDALYAPGRHEAYISAQRASANRSNTAAAKDRDADKLTIRYNSGTGSFSIPKNDWNNPSTLGAIANQLGIEVNWEEFGKSSKSKIGEGVIEVKEGGKMKYLNKGELQTLIGKALDNPKNAEKAAAIAAAYGGGAVSEAPQKGGKQLSVSKAKSSKKEDKPKLTV